LLSYLKVAGAADGTLQFTELCKANRTLRKEPHCTIRETRNLPSYLVRQRKRIVNKADQKTKPVKTAANIVLIDPDRSVRSLVCSIAWFCWLIFA